MHQAHLRLLLRVLTFLTAVNGLVQAGADQPHDPASGRIPSVVLPGILNGESAIQHLAEHLPAVALAYGHTPDALRGLLRSDRTLHVDESGRLLYLDVHLPEEAAGQTASTITASGAAPYPLANTFFLHSRPGSKRVLYLDFDGHVLTGTAWNSTANSTINCPPWDIDGNPSSFSDTERTIIQGIWQRVAEDYLPFDVDVTTEYPGEAAMTRSSSTDDAYGMRVLISPISSYFGKYGGIAYVGVFNYTSDYYKPALVFPENLANSEKYIAEAVAHEAGHTLGLNHDGTTTGSAYYAGHGSGETGWAPIMGVGYYQALTQWSKGEYSAANNKQDDLAVMQSYGLLFRADDHGNTTASATVLPTAATLSASGIIERNTDVDAFAFATGAGPITIQVAPSWNSPNLDVFAQLYDSKGVLIASSNPYGYLAASISAAVPAGTCYLFVRGTGQGDPLSGYSSYASLGAYSVTGTVPAPSGNQPPVAVASATPVTGYAPLAVSFDGSASSDPEGGTLLFHWNFGNGSTASGATAACTFTTSGVWPVTLTVTDAGGLTAQTTVSINVSASQDLSKEMCVGSLSVTTSQVAGGITSTAKIRIVDGSGRAVPGATVSGSWSGSVTGTSTGTTDSNGQVAFISKKYKKAASVTFSVTNVSKSGFTYNASLNTATKASSP